MGWTRWLAALPPLGILVGAAVFNDTHPIVFGMPLLLAWLVLCVVLSSAVMGVIYWCDPVRRPGDRR